MVVNYNLVVDFARPSKTNTILIAENDVNSRNCCFKLLSDKTPFDMTNVTTATVQGVLPTGSIIIGEATIVQDEDENNINEVTYLIPSALTETPGTVTMTITLADSEGARITSFEFYLKVRNTLYNEDDYISDEDLSGFRDLLARARAALARMEQMVQADALPNPYPLRIEVDGVEYEYTGDDLVEIFMGDVAYIGEVTGLVEVTEDDSSAGRAAASAEEAAQSAQDCEDTLQEINEIITNWTDKIPTATVTKNETTHRSVITITDQNGTTEAEVVDGVIGNEWYLGTVLTGEGTGQTGVAGLEGDFYLNTTTLKVYRCVMGGDATSALWNYSFSLVDVSSTYTGGTGIDISGGVISLDYASLIASGEDKPVSSGTIYDLLAGSYYTKDDVYNKTQTYSKSEVYNKTETYSAGDTTSSDANDTAFFPFYDDYSSSFFKITWGNIKSKIKSYLQKYWDEYTDEVTQNNGTVTFTNLNKDYGYELEYDSPDSETGDLNIPTYTKINKSAPQWVNIDGNLVECITLVYTIKGGTNGTSKFRLRIKK